MFNSISSRTPEGSPNECHICGARVCIEPSTVPRYDAPCPNCGTLLVFDEPTSVSFSVLKCSFDKILDFVDSDPMNNKRKKIYLDFTGVDSLERELLGQIFGLKVKIKLRNWKLRICNANKEIEEVLNIIKFDKLFS